MIDTHKKWIEEIFDRASPTYGERESSYFDYYGEKLVSLAGLNPGDNILDVATGKGAVLFPASRAIGSHGRAFGIDLSQGMIEGARKRVQFPWVHLGQMDAEELRFPDATFDAVLCGFAAFFFPNRMKAFSEFKRVLKTGGRLALSIWGNPCPLDAWMAERAKELGAVRMMRVGTPLDTKEALKQLLGEAGFDAVQIVEEKATFWHANGASYWESLWSHGCRARLEQLAADKLELLKREVMIKAEMERAEPGIPHPVQAFIAVAS